MASLGSQAPAPSQTRRGLAGSMSRTRLLQRIPWRLREQIPDASQIQDLDELGSTFAKSSPVTDSILDKLPTEILRIIMDACAENPDGPERLKTLLSLSRTCRRLNEIALPYVRPLRPYIHGYGTHVFNDYDTMVAQVRSLSAFERSWTRNIEVKPASAGYQHPRVDVGVALSHFTNLRTLCVYCKWNAEGLSGLPHAYDSFPHLETFVLSTVQTCTGICLNVNTLMSIWCAPKLKVVVVEHHPLKWTRNLPNRPKNLPALEYLRIDAGNLEGIEELAQIRSAKRLAIKGVPEAAAFIDENVTGLSLLSDGYMHGRGFDDSQEHVWALLRNNREKHFPWITHLSVRNVEVLEADINSHVSSIRAVQSLLDLVQNKKELAPKLSQLNLFVDEYSWCLPYVVGGETAHRRSKKFKKTMEKVESACKSRDVKLTVFDPKELGKRKFLGFQLASLQVQPGWVHFPYTSKENKTATP